MDLVFHTLQLGFFYMDFDLISKSIDKAKKYATYEFNFFTWYLLKNKYIHILVCDYLLSAPACLKKVVIGKERIV